MIVASRLVLVASGFLIAVLWFDLMFDVQVWRHPGTDSLPESVLESIARYYRRVTTDASPMGRLVGLSMLVLVGSIGAQAIAGGTPGWVSVVSGLGAVTGPGLAGARVFRNARRLARRQDPLNTQSALARTIARDHVVCLAAMVLTLVVQLVRPT